MIYRPDLISVRILRFFAPFCFHFHFHTSTFITKKEADCRNVSCHQRFDRNSTETEPFFHD